MKTCRFSWIGFAGFISNLRLIGLTTLGFLFINTLSANDTHRVSSAVLVTGELSVCVKSIRNFQQELVKMSFVTQIAKVFLENDTLNTSSVSQKHGRYLLNCLIIQIRYHNLKSANELFRGNLFTMNKGNSSCSINNNNQYILAFFILKSHINCVFVFRRSRKKLQKLRMFFMNIKSNDLSVITQKYPK